MLRTILISAGLLAATPALAQQVDPRTDLGQFRTLRADGVQALQQGDATMALEKLRAAQALMPDSPSIWLLQAQVFLEQHQKGKAHDTLVQYLKRGYVVDLKRNTDFNQVWDSDLEDMQNANQGPIGDMFTTAKVNDFTVTEGLAYSDESNTLYVSGVRTGEIISLSPAGVKDIAKLKPGVAAYGLGLHDGLLWASTAATRQTIGYDAAKSGPSRIVSLNPDNGNTLSSVNAPAGVRFGHLALGKDDLYVVDANHGAVLRLNGYGKTFDTLIPEGYMDTPSGIVENADASSLVVSDFISGLYRVDLNAGVMTHLAPPDGGVLLGLSSLSRYGNDLVGVQTGFDPPRIVRLRMNDDWTQVLAVEVLLRGNRALEQPSQGQVVDDNFVFIAQSQWNYLETKPTTDAAPPPSLIGTLKLQP